MSTISTIGFDADDTLLCINHYRYSSFEFMYGIKEGRTYFSDYDKINYKQIVY